MRLLLDTNVVIHLEDASASLAEIAASLSRLAHQHSVTLVVHEASRDDFDRDIDKERKFANITKAAKYPTIDQPPAPTAEFLTEFGTIGSDNDRVDAALLYAIQKGRARSSSARSRSARTAGGGTSANCCSRPRSVHVRPVGTRMPSSK